MPIGCKVTLRKDKMYEFLDRLISVAIPRIRDFRGFSKKSFDGRGNYTLGIKEQIIFPEIDYEKISIGSIHMHKGVPLVASHPDMVCPSPDGGLPDVGAYLAMLKVTTGIDPRAHYRQTKPWNDYSQD